ncbi:allophanate hydrolase subunit 1 [Paeniglutamicibacter antarcticus]|uniref:Allophanate hydrolase subunit 1 n=1 Tax=Arthrobacter terrae TaxID=2935737 RepID=A0A931G849_9MICC|nr:allophanate hydrolase subunit 1 [Arthrobacter terrae]MBG0739919.1 allophanate hydrolase subunit 1 [Arthrobacter terrae]
MQLTGAPEPILLPCGDGAVLAELPNLQAVLGYYRGLSRSTPAGLLDLVPAARTVLATFDPDRVSVGTIRRWMLGTTPLQGSVLQAPEVVIDVRYDGPDLAVVAHHLGLTEAQVVNVHSSSLWTAAFTGFAPGFAYLVTDHERLRVPRRNVPRTKVPAGAVALGGEFSAIYPAASPGGWQLIGHTDAAMWGSGNGPLTPGDALITPGTLVRFRES